MRPRSSPGTELKLESIRRGRDACPAQLKCRCVGVSRIREHHEANDKVVGAFRMHEAPTGEGETASGERPAHVQAHLERIFMVTQPNTKWVTGITCIHVTERWLHLCVVIDLARS